jgi:hypothetical protein
MLQFSTFSQRLQTDFRNQHKAQVPVMIVVSSIRRALNRFRTRRSDRQVDAKIRGSFAWSVRYISGTAALALLSNCEHPGIGAVKNGLRKHHSV